MNKKILIPLITVLLLPSKKLLGQSLVDIIHIAKVQSLDAKVAYKSFPSMKPQLTFSTIPIQYSNNVVQRYSYEQDQTYYRTQNSLFSTGNLKFEQNIGFLGGTLFADTDLRFYKTFGTNSYQQFTSIPFRIGYSHNILGYNPFKWRKKIEPLKFQLACKRKLYELELVAIKAIKLYFDVALLTEEKKISEENLSNCEYLLKLGKEKHKLGRMTLLDLHEVELEHSKAQNNLMQVEIDFKISVEKLKRYLNLKENDTIMVCKPAYIPKIIIPKDFAIQLAIENATDLISSKRNILEKEQEIDKLKKQKVLESSFSVSLGWHQIDERFEKAYRSPLSEQLVSLSFAIPIVDYGKRKTAYQQAKTDREIASLYETQIRENIIQEMMDYTLTLPIQYDLIQSATKEYEIAMMAYEEAINLYKNGKANFSQVCNYRINKLSALKKYYTAIKEYCVIYYQIRSYSLYDFIKKEPIKEPQIDNLKKGFTNRV